VLIDLSGANLRLATWPSSSQCNSPITDALIEGSWWYYWKASRLNQKIISSFVITVV